MIRRPPRPDEPRNRVTQPFGIDWFGEMLRESGRFTGGAVFIHSVTTERNAGEPVSFPHSAHEFEAASIWKSKIADQQIEISLVGQLFRCGEAVGMAYLVAASFQQA